MAAMITFICRAQSSSLSTLSVTPKLCSSKTLLPPHRVPGCFSPCQSSGALKFKTADTVRAEKKGLSLVCSYNAGEESDTKEDICAQIELIVAIMESETAEQSTEKISEMDSGKIEKKKNRRNGKKRRRRLSKFGCFRSEDYGHSTVEESDAHGNFDMESASNYGKDRVRAPTHLIVTVNGIIGSAQNWRFAAKQFLKRYPHDVIVHCSESNYSMLTFDGVDVMGSRLADEVLSIIKHHPGLQKISFIGHSLGGLIARYAIAKLYERDFTNETGQENRESPSREEKVKGKIAGLEPMNFITSATPHLGSRGHRQVPVFCGFRALEKVASRLSWCLGRTGKHLFLMDSENGKPPLLLQMASDCEDLKFISALQSFKRRVAYANARFDHIVGWSTSSLRRRSELPKHLKLSRNNKYPHIISEETAKADGFHKEAQLNGQKIDDIEEAMLKGLTKVSWERVDVSFRGSKQRFLAHSTIQASIWLSLRSHNSSFYPSRSSNSV